MEYLVKNQKARLPLLKSKPKISVGCICQNEVSLKLTVQSFVNQSYSGWELILISDTGVNLKIEDERVKIVKTPFSTTADAKNAALKEASGEWFGLIEAGDVLSPVCLFQFVYAMQAKTQEVLFYCNEAKYSSAKNEVSEFWSKGQPSEFNLLHFNSVGRFFLIKTALLQESLKFEPKYSPEEELGLFLNLRLKNSEWGYIPEYLYYRQENPLTSVVKQREIVEDYLRKKDFRAFVGRTQSRLDIQPFLTNPSSHLISAIVLFKDKPEMTLRCLKALERQQGEVPLEVILINNQSKKATVAELKKGLASFTFTTKWVDYEEAFNFGHMNNLAIRTHAMGDLLILLNNDVFLEGNRNLDLMAAWALVESTGTVGVRLHYEHGKIQHSGFEGFFGGFSRLVRVGNAQGRGRFGEENHEVFGSTFACAMMKRSTYETLGGFREIDLANGFGDIAFSFECLRRGLHNLYLGHIRGLHLESVSRGMNYEYWEECVLEREYADILQKMVREDLGINKIPGSEDAVLEVIRESALGTLRKHAPWLKTVKRTIEKRIKNSPLEAT